MQHVIQAIGKFRLVFGVFVVIAILINNRKLTWTGVGGARHHRLVQCPQQHPVDDRTDEADSRN